MSDLLSEFKRNVPELSIFCAQDTLTDFCEDHGGNRGEIPVALAKPESVKQLTDLVLFCKEAGLRIQPVSSSGERYRGDTRCVSDTIIADMSAFNEVIRTDRRNRVLMFEAGVTFDLLEASAKATGLRPMLPLCPKPGKSALTSYLDREPTISPRFQWDMSDPMLCVEMVTGTGQLFRTGAAAGPGDLTDQWKAGDAQKFPMGPGAIDAMRIFQGAQGGLGVVTWCTAKAESIPEGEDLYVLENESLEPLIETAYGLLRRHHPDICFILNGAGLAAITHREFEDWQKKKAQLSPWHLVFSLSTPKFAGAQKLAYVKKEISALCEKHGLTQSLSGFQVKQRHLHDIITSPAHPLNERWWKLAGMPSTREFFFQTTLDKAPLFLPAAKSICQQHKRGWDNVLCYIQPQLGGRCCHMEFIFPTDQSALSASNEMMGLLTKSMKSNGAFFSRPYGTFGEAAFAGESGLPVIRKLKNIFDPQRIFSPNSFIFSGGQSDGKKEAA
jgi:hypothetical protein